jgi:glycerol-3-phosphate dehydrogenase
MVTVAGGGLTTCRRSAAAVLEAFCPALDLRAVGPSAVLLPGAVGPRRAVDASLRRLPGLDGGIAASLVRPFGSLAFEVFALADWPATRRRVARLLAQDGVSGGGP